MALAGTWLDIDRENVAWKQSDDLWVDLHQFRQQLAQCQQHDHPGNEVCSECLPLLTGAATLYQDDFLAGFTLRDSPNFDEWQKSEGFVEIMGIFGEIVGFCG